MKNILALFSGSIFGLGLTISSMTNPDKVLGFLDLFNNWDPSLAFVMGGAIIITAPMLFVLTKNKNLILSKEIHLPTNKEIDKKLIIGSLIFGRLGFSWIVSRSCNFFLSPFRSAINYFCYFYVYRFLLFKIY